MRSHSENQEIEWLNDVAVIWYSEKVDSFKNDPHSRTLHRLIYRPIEILNDPEQCQNSINESLDQIFLITSLEDGHYIIPMIHDLPQLHTIYILDSTQKDQRWIKKYSKIEHVYGNQNELYNKLFEQISKVSKQRPLFQLYDTGKTTQEFESLAFKDKGRMWFQLFISVLIRTKYDDCSIKRFINEYRKQHENHLNEKKCIDEFEKTYESSLAVKWYTSDTFIFKLFNKMMRFESIQWAILMHFFIYDLHQHIDKQFKENKESFQPVYRGQLMSKNELAALENSHSAFFVNQFFSTTKNRDVANIFAGAVDNNNDSTYNDLKKVLFEIKITNYIQIPYADISKLSSIEEEEEILFSIGSSFETQNVLYNEDSQCYIIQLKTIDLDCKDDWCDDTESENDRNCRVDEKRMNEADLILAGYWLDKKSGDDKEVITYYNSIHQFLPQVFCDGAYWCGLGLIEFERQRYDKALDYFNKALQFYNARHSSIISSDSQTDIEDQSQKREHYLQCILFTIDYCISSINFVNDQRQDLLKHFMPVIKLGFGCFFSWTLGKILEQFLEYAVACKFDGNYDQICLVQDTLNRAAKEEESFELALNSWLGENLHRHSDEITFFVAVLNSNLYSHINNEEINESMTQNEELVKYILNKNYDEELILIYREMGDIYSKNKLPDLAFSCYNEALNWFDSDKKNINLENFLYHVAISYLINQQSHIGIELFQKYFRNCCMRTERRQNIYNKMCQQITVDNKTSHDPNELIIWYENIFEICEDLNNEPPALLFYEDLADTYTLRGFSQLAREMYRKIVSNTSNASKNHVEVNEIINRCSKKMDQISD